MVEAARITELFNTLSKIEYLPGQTTGEEAIAIVPHIQDLKHGISLGPRSFNMAESFEKENKEGVILRIEKFLATLQMSGLESAFLILPPRGEDAHIFDVTEREVADSKLRQEVREDVESDVRASAIFTDIPNVPLLCKPADCPVVILSAVSSRGNKVVGLIHSGRSETNLRIPTQAIAHIKERYGCDPSSIKVGIAPGIGKKNYFIKASDSGIINESQWDRFSTKRTKDGEERIYLDILGNICDQLNSESIPSQNIHAYGNSVDTYDLASQTPPLAYSARYAGITNDLTRNGRLLVAVQL